jgi:hypothetical protein
MELLAATPRATACLLANRTVESIAIEGVLNEEYPNKREIRWIEGE